MTRGRGRPPLWRPVEAIAIRGQSRGCWEADDCCGDPAAFAVDPAAVIGFQVEVGTTRERHRETINNSILYYTESMNAAFS